MQGSNGFHCSAARSKALANDDFDRYNPPSMFGDDGMLESIVNQAIATNGGSFDTRNRQKEDAGYNGIDGWEYYSMCMAPDNRNTMTSSMDALVPCFNNTCGGSADPWVADIIKETESDQVVIQEEDDQVLPQRGVQVEDADQMLPQPPGYAAMIVHMLEEDADQMNVQERNDEVVAQGYATEWSLFTGDNQEACHVPENSEIFIQEKNDEAVLPQGYATEWSLFTGDSEDACHVPNENDAMRIHRTNIFPSVCRTSSMHSSAGQKRGSASRKFSSSMKGKGMKAATNRKHNKSEQTRRDVIKQKMKTLHDLVPCHSKTLKASKSVILTEVHHYVKQLQAQVETLMSMMNTVPCPMMDCPMAANVRQMSNAHSAMAHPRLHITTMDAKGINTNTNANASTSFPAIFVHPTTALSPFVYVPESHQF